MNTIAKKNRHKDITSIKNRLPHDKDFEFLILSIRLLPEVTYVKFLSCFFSILLISFIRIYFLRLYLCEVGVKFLKQYVLIILWHYKFHPEVRHVAQFT